MPVFKSGKGLAPKWCELEYFEIVDLKPGEKHTFERRSKKEKLIVGKGECKIRFGGQERQISQSSYLDLDITAEGDRFEIVDTLAESKLIRMCGRWGDKTGGYGVFSVEKNEHPQDNGDPVGYPKETNFDNHYHDCDEYWIIFQGNGIAVSEGKEYKVGAGDCIVTGMGYHHDFPKIFEPVKGAFFETTMEGEKRRGHLWEHKHGKPVPRTDRV